MREKNCHYRVVWACYLHCFCLAHPHHRHLLVPHRHHLHPNQPPIPRAISAGAVAPPHPDSNRPSPSPAAMQLTTEMMASPGNDHESAGNASPPFLTCPAAAKVPCIPPLEQPALVYSFLM